MCSTNSMATEPRWGQFLSTSVEILPHHLFTATALWITDQRNVVSSCALCLCQMMFHLREVEGGIPLCHLSRIDFLKTTWEVIQILPNLVEYAINDVTPGHHHHAGSKNSWFNFPTNKLNWVWALPRESPSTLTLDIQPKKALWGTICLALVSVKYCNPTMDLGKEPIYYALTSTVPELKALRYPTQTTHSSIISSTFLYKPTHSREVGLAPCWLDNLSRNKPKCSTSLFQKSE